MKRDRKERKKNTINTVVSSEARTGAVRHSKAVQSEAMVWSLTNRHAVYVKGPHDVSLCNGVFNRAIWPFIQIHSIDGNKDGIECAWTLIQCDFMLLLLEDWGIVILIQDGYIHSCSSLWANRDTFRIMRGGDERDQI